MPLAGRTHDHLLWPCVLCLSVEALATEGVQTWQDPWINVRLRAQLAGDILLNGFHGSPGRQKNSQTYIYIYNYTNIYCVTLHGSNINRLINNNHMVCNKLELLLLFNCYNVCTETSYKNLLVLV